MNKRGLSDFTVLIGLVVICMGAIGVSSTFTRSSDVEFANEETKALQRDILELKAEILNVNTRIDLLGGDKSEWLKKIEDLSNLHKFLSDQSGKSRRPLSNGPGCTSENIPSSSGSRAPSTE